MGEKTWNLGKLLIVEGAFTLKQGQWLGYFEQGSWREQLGSIPKRGEPLT